MNATHSQTSEVCCHQTEYKRHFAGKFLNNLFIYFLIPLVLLDYKLTTSFGMSSTLSHLGRNDHCPEGNPPCNLHCLPPPRHSCGQRQWKEELIVRKHRDLKVILVSWRRSCRRQRCSSLLRLSPKLAPQLLADLLQDRPQRCTRKARHFGPLIPSHGAL